MTKYKWSRDGFRWPWQSKPGFVRVKRGEYVRLLEGAVKVSRLETEIALSETATAAYEREHRAHVLAAEQEAIGGVLLDPVRLDELLSNLPVTSDGTIHEPAFLALLGQHLLEQRLGAQILTTNE